MTYTITLGRATPGQTVVMLDNPCPLAIPPYVSIGVVNRKKRYMDWLEGCLINDDQNKDKTQRLNFLAFIHKIGREQGYIVLDSKHSLKTIQTECVQEFLIKHKQFLDDVLPYIFSDVMNVTDKKTNQIKPITEGHTSA